MTAWNHTAEAAAFIASGDSRETDKRIMIAIAFFAADASEAETFWNGDFDGKCDMLSIWENATKNGTLDADEMHWGQTTLAAALAA